MEQVKDLLHPDLKVFARTARVQGMVLVLSF
jgi:hypothetical protein